MTSLWSGHDSVGPIGITVLASVEGFAILTSDGSAPFLLVFKTKHT